MDQVLRALQQQQEQNQQLLRTLVDNQLGGGSGPGAAGARGGADKAPQAVWACGCGFKTNFERRSHCYRCGAARGSNSRAAAAGGGAGGGGTRTAGGGGSGGGAAPSSGSLSAPSFSLRPRVQQASTSSAASATTPLRPANSGSSAGPVGAHGNRPMLSWATRLAASVEKPSIPERRTASAGTDSKVASAQPARSTVGQAAAVKDGFTPVQRRWDSRLAGVKQGAGGTDDGGCGEAARRVSPSDGQDEDVPMPAADAGGGAQAEVRIAAEEADQDEDGQQEPPSVDQLRADFEQQRQLVAMLEKQGRSDEDPTLAAARTQRDDAKAAWDAARNAPPQHLRLRWAEQALEKAQRAKERAEQEIRSLDEEHTRRRSELCAELEQRKLRLEMRQEKVDEIRLEVGALAGRARGKGDGGQASLVGLLQEIDGVIGPGLTGLVGTMDTDSEPYRVFNQLLDKLQDACGNAAKAVQVETTADRYDIGDDADDGISDISDTIYADGAPAQQGNVKGGTAGGPSPADVNPPTPAPAHPKPPTPPRMGQGRGKRAGEEDAVGLANKSRRADGDQGDGEEQSGPSPQELAEDEQKAKELEARQKAMQQAGFDNPLAVQMAAEEFHRLVESVQAKAAEAEVPLEGVQLANMSPDEVRVWAEQRGIRL